MTVIVNECCVRAYRAVQDAMSLDDTNQVPSKRVLTPNHGPNEGKTSEDQTIKPGLLYNWDDWDDHPNGEMFSSQWPEPLG